MKSMAIRDSKGDRAFDLINLTLMTLLMLVVLYPLVVILSASISDPELVKRGAVVLWPKGVTFEGYLRVFQDINILIGYRNTILYTVGGTIINLLLTLPAAYTLSKRHLVGRNIVMFLMAFTMYFSGGIIPSYLLMKNLGLTNTYFVLMLCGGVTTTNLIISRTFFANGVPQELEEAAYIDGCSVIRTFVTIVLPLSKAIIGVMTLYYGVAHWNSFFNALIYVTDRAKIPLQLVLREILVEQQIKANMMAAGSAVDELLLDKQMRVAELVKYSVIVVSSLPVLVAYPFLQKYFDKGVMIGSIKG